MPGKRVVVAMSGGVDSSVTAGLLTEQGYEVSGITLELQLNHAEAIEHASSVAEHLGISHQALDLSQVFGQKIIEPFCREYAQGITPNPCVKCNRYIKFGVLLDLALASGADFLATGHYVRVKAENQGYRLLKGIDSQKDQSYFLYTLTQAQLGHVLFPLGERNKSEVRQEAKRLGIAHLVRQEESQDICFIPGGDYGEFIARYETPRPGNIVDGQGRVLGRHKGLAHYTVGQRQGLGLATDKRLYVQRLDAATNRVVVGDRDSLYSPGLVASELAWVSGVPPADWQGVTAKVRYKTPEVAVRVHFVDNRAEVRFAEPQWAIAPGQSIVFYKGDEVLGGGIIQGQGEGLDR